MAASGAVAGGGAGAGVEPLLGDLRYIFRGGVVLDMTASRIYLGY